MTLKELLAKNPPDKTRKLSDMQEGTLPYIVAKGHIEHGLGYYTYTDGNTNEKVLVVAG